MGWIKSCKCKTKERIEGPEGVIYCGLCKKAWREVRGMPLPGTDTDANKKIDAKLNVLGQLAEVMHADIVRLESMVCYMMDRQFDDISKQPTTDQARRLAAMGEKPWEKVVVRATWFEQWQAAYEKLQADREAKKVSAEEPPPEVEEDVSQEQGHTQQ